MTAGGASIAFDRAAGYYDATRRQPEEVMAAQTALLARELAAAGRVIEVGVGTGRIAIPLAQAGVRVVGADLSAPMLHRLVAKAPGVVPVVVADATRLPFGDRAFDGAVVAHLLHLVPAWEQALDELVRVLRPGGRLLVLLGREAELARELRDRVGVAAGRGRPGVVGLASDADLDALLVDRGLLARSLPEIPNPQTVTVAELLERVAAQQYAWTWPIEPGLLRRAVAETTAWVRATHGEPTEVVIRGWSVRWRAYDLPC